MLAKGLTRVDRVASPRTLHILSVSTISSTQFQHVAPGFTISSDLLLSPTIPNPCLPIPGRIFGSLIWFSSVSTQTLANFSITGWVKSNRAWLASPQSLSLLPQISRLFSISSSCILAWGLTFYHYLHFSKSHLPWVFQGFQSSFPSLTAHHISVPFFSIS